MQIRIAPLALAAALAIPTVLRAQATDTAGRTPGCTSCAEWNVPQRPFRVFGNTWFVGRTG